MTTDEKVNIMYEEINDQAGMIPAYMEKYYRKAIATGFAKIDKEEKDYGRNAENAAD